MRRLPLSLVLVGGFVFVAGLSLSACSGGAGGNQLQGPTSYDLVFDRVVIFRQETAGNPVAMIVKYEKQNKSSIEVPAKIVANFPVDPDVTKDLLKDGSLSRVMQNQVQFPAMERGQVTFDAVDVGKESCGKFYVTFAQGSGTLNGEFCATVQVLIF